MTIVSQSSPIQKKTSNSLRFLFWTFLLILASPSSLLSLLFQKHLLIQLRLKRRQPHFYSPLTIPQLQSQTSLLPSQLDYNSQFRSLETISPKLPKNFLHLIRFYLTFDPYFHAPLTSDFILTTLFLDVSAAVSTILAAHAKQNDPAPTNIYNTVSN